MTRAAVVGLGKMGVSHLGILNGSQRVTIVGICDKSRFVLDAFKRFTSFEGFDDYEAMYEKANPELVVIATPTNTHFEVVKYFLDKNVHVFVEKPFGTEYAKAYELTEAARTKEINTQVGYHNRFVATFREARRLLQAGVLGDVYHFSAEVNGPAFIKESKSTWRSKGSEGGGALLDYGSHLLNLAIYYWGVPTKVSGTIMKKIYSGGSEDAVFSNLFFPGGLTGNVTVNWSESTFRRMSISIAVSGKSGKIVVDPQRCRIFLKESNKKENLSKGWNTKYITDLASPVDFFVRGEEYTEQLEYFVETSQYNKRGENINSFENSIKTLKLIEMLRSDAEWS